MSLLLYVNSAKFAAQKYQESILTVASGLKQRVLTAFIFGIPVLGLLFFSDLTRTIFVAALLFLTGIEYLQLHYKPLTKSLIPVIISLLVMGGLAYVSLNKLVPPIWLLIPTLLVSFLFLIDLLFIEVPFLRAIPWLTNLGYTTLPFSLLLAQSSLQHFSALIIGSLILIWVSDSGAYFVGRSIGKRKLMPTVSPGKTWEGFWGAGMCTVLASYLFFSLMGVFSLQTWVCIALSVWLFGSLGDLVESKIKRRLKIKDSGTLLPGHGGFLDRFDGYYFCLPFVILSLIITNQL